MPILSNDDASASRQLGAICYFIEYKYVMTALRTQCPQGAYGITPYFWEMAAAKRHYTNFKQVIR